MAIDGIGRSHPSLVNDPNNLNKIDRHPGTIRIGVSSVVLSEYGRRWPPVLARHPTRDVTRAEGEDGLMHGIIPAISGRVALGNPGARALSPILSPSIPAPCEPQLRTPTT
jgi:hypothetical protein